MIRIKDMGNPFAPAYRVQITVGDDYVPCDGFGRGTETYVPAWGFLEQARSLAILDRWAVKARRSTPSPFPTAGGRWFLACGLGDFAADSADKCRKLAADAALAADASLGEGLYL